MANTGKQEDSKSSRIVGPEPRIGGIQWTPAPDAEDRLRRLFTLLASHMEEADVKPANHLPLPVPPSTEGRDE